MATDTGHTERDGHAARVIDSHNEPPASSFQAVAAPMGAHGSPLTHHSRAHVAVLTRVPCAGADDAHLHPVGHQGVASSPAASPICVSVRSQWPELWEGSRGDGGEARVVRVAVPRGPADAAVEGRGGRVA